MSSRDKKLQDLFATTALTQRMMHLYIMRAFDDLGVAPSQLHLLHTVERLQPVSLKTLASEMRLTPGAITQLIEAMVQAGYVERSSNDTDRRVIVVALTKSGNETVVLLKRKKQALLAKVVADLDDNELAIFLRVQQKMLTYLETNCRNLKK